MLPFKKRTNSNQKGDGVQYLQYPNQGKLLTPMGWMRHFWKAESETQNNNEDRAQVLEFR